MHNICPIDQDVNKIKKENMKVTANLLCMGCPTRFTKPLQQIAQDLNTICQIFVPKKYTKRYTPSQPSAQMCICYSVDHLRKS